MASVTQKVNNYVLGMSTQPDSQKYPGQVVDLVNGLPDVVQQLMKRPGSKLVNTLTPSTAAHSKWFDIYTDVDEQYIGQVAADGALKIWRGSDATEIPVDYTDVAGSGVATYLDNTALSDEKSSDIQALTINQTTFFVNRRKTVAMKTDASSLQPTQPFEAYIALDSIAYGKQYAIDIYDIANNTTYSYPRATSLVVDEVVSLDGSSTASATVGAGDCKGMGREYVTVHSGTAIGSTSPPNPSSGGKSNLRYEMDTRCTPQPDDNDDADDYHDAYNPYCKLQFGGEGWETNDTHQHTSQKGLTTTVTIKNHVTVTSRANIAMVRPEATSSNAEEHVSAAGILGDLKATLDAISGTGITCTIVGNGIHLYRATKFGVSTPEKTLLNVTTSECNTIADLPRTCRHGYVVRVANSEEDVDDYFLRFQVEGIEADITQTGTYARSGTTITVTKANHGLSNGDQVIMDITSGGATDGMYTLQSVADVNTFTVTDSASGTISAGETCTFTPARFGEGVWEEVCEPGLEIEIDNTTMPLALTRILPTSSTNVSISTSNVNTGNETITSAAHGFSTGQAVIYNNGGGTALAGLTHNTGYFIIKVDNSTFKVATTEANATAGTAINLTGTGNSAQYFQWAYPMNGTNTALPNGGFKFSYPDWGKRDVGDEVTNSKPSFIGQTIQKMIFFRNRICILSAENVILSRVNDFYNFWVKTAMAISNADPIDLQSSSTYPTKLFDAIEQAGGLVIFSASEQFLLSSGAEALLTPETAKISFLSSYAFNSDTNPIELGITIGFLNSTSKYTRFYEMAAVSQREEPTIVEQSKVIYNLFPTNSSMITGSTENNLVLFGVDSTLHTATNEVWGYKWHQTEGRRDQSAWFRWTLPNNLIYHTIMDDIYYVVLNTGSTYTLEKFDIKLKSDTHMIGTAPDDNRVYLDTKKTFATGDLTYNTAADTTTFTLGAGYYSSRNLTAYCIAAGDSNGRSYDIPASAITGTAPSQTVTLPGNWKTSTNAGASINTDIVIGYEYEFEVELPKIYLLRAEGDRMRAETRGSLVIHRMNFDFGDVGVIDVTMKRKGRDDYTYTVESLEWDNVLASRATIADNYMHTIPVYDRNVNLSVLIKSNHPSPATIHSMNWEGDYSPKYYQRV